MKELDFYEVEIVSGGNMPEASVGGDTSPTYTTFSNFSKMQELDDNDLEEISGGNIPESSVGDAWGMG
ncbi:hypothetical protein [Janthinobacterium sp. PSPC3-1]|uniref:hypothetical protein n=1 Tax=Janthinobacterium sp. PSPC3-1 TaxID=2804653 RepID=UPI003CF70FF7